MSKKRKTEDSNPSEVEINSLSIDILPDDVLNHTARFMSTKVVPYIGLVSKRWNHLFGGDDAYLWQLKIKDKLGIPLDTIQLFEKYVKKNFSPEIVPANLLKRIFFNIAKFKKNLYLIKHHWAWHEYESSPKFYTYLLACLTNEPSIALKVMTYKKASAYIYYALMGGCEKVAYALQKSNQQIDQSDSYIKKIARQYGDFAMAIRMNAFDDLHMDMMTTAILNRKIDVIKYLLEMGVIEKQHWDHAVEQPCSRVFELINQHPFNPIKKLEWLLDAAGDGNVHAIRALNKLKDAPPIVRFKGSRLASIQNRIFQYENPPLSVNQLKSLPMHEYKELINYCAMYGCEKSFTTIMEVLAEQLGYHSVSDKEFNLAAYVKPETLKLAAKGDCLALVKYIISLGVSPNQDTLIFAITGGNMDIIQYLMDEKNKFKFNLDSDLLVECIYAGSLTIIEHLLEKGVTFPDNIDVDIQACKIPKIASYVMLKMPLSSSQFYIPNKLLISEIEFINILEAENIFRQAWDLYAYTSISSFMARMESAIQCHYAHTAERLADILHDREKYMLSDEAYLALAKHSLLRELNHPPITLKIMELVQAELISIDERVQFNMLTNTNNEFELFVEYRQESKAISEALQKLIADQSHHLRLQ